MKLAVVFWGTFLISGLIVFAISFGGNLVNTMEEYPYDVNEAQTKAAELSVAIAFPAAIIIGLITLFITGRRMANAKEPPKLKQVLAERRKEDLAAQNPPDIYNYHVKTFEYSKTLKLRQKATIGISTLLITLLLVGVWAESHDYILNETWIGWIIFILFHALFQNKIWTEVFTIKFKYLTMEKEGDKNKVESFEPVDLE